MTDWSQIVREHGTTVWRTVYRMVGSDADAADCFQNVFVAAIEVSQKEPVKNWEALLQRLASARSLECLRRRYRKSDQLTVPLETLSVDDNAVDHNAVDHSAADPSDLAAGRELAEELRQALVEIDDRQAHVFCLSCIEGVAYREIADQLGITVNHVGVLLSRARSSLQKRLRAFEPASTPLPLDRETFK